MAKPEPGKPFEKRPYRKCVGALLFDRKGRVFVARRRDTRDAWQLPQGGVDKGEKPRQAVLRELEEEIGTSRAEILAKSREWLAYDLPRDVADRVWKGRYRGQKQRWFALLFTGEEGDIDLEGSGHPEFDAWKWVDISELPGLAVSFKRPVYEALTAEFTALARKLADP